MKNYCLIIIATIFQLTTSAQTPNTFIIDANHLVQVKLKLEQKDSVTLKLVDALKKKADALLSMKPVSIMDKAFTPPSGNKHDYMSQAPYFWYDSSKANGLPYIRRDGEHNPEIKKITDHTYFSNLENATKTLSLAWYLTSEEKYANKASALLHYWFFDAATKMNPNLEYAQGIPGITNGRGIGIIESRSLTGIADAAALLAGAPSWTTNDRKQLRDWYKEYLHWMLTSKNGKEEHYWKNNHGTWFYVQAIDFALFTDDKNTALQLVNESKKRLDSQLTKEGKFPLELERTNGLGYSTFVTSAWFQVATLAEKIGVDPWHYKTTSGASLQTAVDWIMPYALKEKKWTYQQISPYNSKDFYPLLLQAAEKFHDEIYLKKANEVSGEKDVMVELLYKSL
ncbi:MAG TPA: alginate lyase family protein [Flavisolibacter sp.]|nr:alginate lyase family protein [Flavisolibacter sp.]